ncbi:MAG: dockerin type I repeat-containing protein [Oscillospiraceae bacterium]|nr:dockerin type I repeat-containing protein [Oscillospiraceae bacterium]
MKKQFLAIISACMAGVLAVECAQLPVYAADQPISVVMFENVCTSLTIGEVPDFTAYLTGDALLHASILNEGWGCTTDMSVHASKTEGLPVPDEPVGVPYSYLIALKADTGWYFPDSIDLYYENSLVDDSFYTATVTNEGQVLMLQCDFIPQVTPLPAGTQMISAVTIEDAVLTYFARETPRFHAHTATGSGCSVFYERWVDDLAPSHFITNNEEFNSAMGLAEEDRLTVFQEGGQYHYDLCVSADYGYAFADQVNVLINGKAYPVLGHTQDFIPINDIQVIVVKQPPATTTAVTTTTAAAATSTKPKSATTVKATTVTEQRTTTSVKTTTVSTVTTPTAVRTIAPLDPALLYGDINEDRRVSVSDAVLLVRFLAEELNRDLTETGLRAADMDRDGILSMLDEMLLLKLLQQQQQTVPPVIVPPKDAEVSDGSDPDPSVLPDTSSFDWIRDPGGDSAAFTEQVLGRVTVSADENALSYDGQLQFSELEDAEAKKLDQVCADAGALMLDAWHIEAGLKPDEHLPGYYTCSYDLSELELPEEMYDQLCLLRIADDGMVSEYPVEIDGSTLSWMSDQNSVTLLSLCIDAAIIVVALGVIVGYAEYDKWLTANGGCVGTYKTNSCTIHYHDNEPQEEKDTRKKRLQTIEADATRQARDYAEEKVGDSWGGIAGLFMNYAREVNKVAAKKKNELLAENTEYQDLMILENGHPADVVLLARQYDIAMDYLYYQEGCPRLKKPDIVFNETVDDLGNASTNYLVSNYMLVRRTPQKDNSHIDKDTSYWDLYGTAVPSAVCDQLLTTLTHELFHLVQATKLAGKTEAYVKFFEMSALTVECHAAQYFQDADHKYIESHVLDDGQCFETYGLPINTYTVSFLESFKQQHHDLLTAAGYSLSYFWRHIEKIQMKQIKGWDMILGYKKYGTIPELINQLFGFADATVSKSEPYGVLNVYWEHYQKLSATEKVAIGCMQDIYSAKNNITQDSKFCHASQTVKHKLSSENPQSRSVVPLKNLACTCVGVSGATDRPWSAVLARDAEFGELQPQHKFLIPASGGKSRGEESKNGLVVSSQEQMLYYRELQNYGAIGKSGYTLHYIPSPDTPDVTIDEENEMLTVQLKSAPSAEGTTGMTDRFLLVCTVNGKETYTQKIAFDKRAEPVKLAFGTLHLSMNHKNKLQIAVCELIDEGTDAAGTKRGDVRTALSKPFEKEIGEANFPEIEQSFRAKLQYGTINQDADVMFKLTKDGSYELTLQDTSWDINSSAGPGNPFVSYKSKGSLTGFNVKGNASNSKEEDIDPTNWAAPISACSTQEFSANENYVDWDDGIYNIQEGPDLDSSDSIIITAVRGSTYVTEDTFKRWVRERNTTVSGGFVSNIIGTLTFQFHAERNICNLTLEISPSLSCKAMIKITPGTNSAPESDGEKEQVLRENSIVLIGSFNVS